MTGQLSLPCVITQKINKYRNELKVSWWAWQVQSSPVIREGNRTYYGGKDLLKRWVLNLQ